MDVVWRSTDSTLVRDVATMGIPDVLALEPERLAAALPIPETDPTYRDESAAGANVIPHH